MLRESGVTLSALVYPLQLKLALMVKAVHPQERSRPRLLLKAGCPRVIQPEGPPEPPTVSPVAPTILGAEDIILVFQDV